MKRFGLLVVLCVVMVCVVCSAAMGALKMNPESFARFCKTASASEIRDAFRRGVDWNEDAWFAAAFSNHDAEVIRLLFNEAKKQGVNFLEWRYPDGKTALSCAASTNPNPAVVKCLIDLGADVHTRNKSNSGPVRAAKVAHTAGGIPNRNEVIRILLEAGADDETAY